MTRRSNARLSIALSIITIGSLGEIAILILRYVTSLRQTGLPGDLVIPVSPTLVETPPPAPEFFFLSVCFFVFMLVGIIIAITRKWPNKARIQP